MRLPCRLFLLITITTVVEVWLLFQLATFTNWWVTVATILLPGIAGAWLIRREGRRALASMVAALGSGREPGQAIVDGAVVLVSGALLMTPGVLTDLAGLLLLIPAVRTVVARAAMTRILRAIEQSLRTGTFRVFGGRPLDMGEAVFDGEVIDAEDIARTKVVR